MSKANCTSQQTKTQSWKMGRDEIIRRCIEKHGPDAFDYSGVAADASGADCKIDVKCNTCQTVFKPRAASHYNRGSRCPVCTKKETGEKNKLTFAEFKRKATNKHEGRYHYPDQEISDSSGYVRITCARHGEFTQRIQVHYSGTGCPKCGAEYATQILAARNAKVKFTGEDFERESRKIYGDILEYDHDSFTTTKGDVRLKCKVHGWFTTNAHAHLYGRNKRKYKKTVKPSQPCPHCRTNALSPEQVVEAFINAYGDKYKLYPVEEMTKPGDKVHIICPSHGVQSITLRQLIRGSECPQCRIDRAEQNKKLNAKTKEEKRAEKESDFIARATKKHEGRYHYDVKILGFRNFSSKVRINCEKHGFFNVAAREHLNGKICPRCAIERTGGWTRTDYIRKSEWSNNGQAMLYLIRLWSDSEVFYKIGITCQGSVSKRFSNKDDLRGIYEYEELRTVEGDAGFIYDLEKQFHRFNRPNKYKPKKYFAGHTECFSEITQDSLFLLDVI